MRKLMSALACCVCLMTALSASASEDSPALVVSLSADRRTYSVGAVPNLRITLTNQTPELVLLHVMPGYDLTRLRITNDSGQLVAPTLPTSSVSIDSHHYEISSNKAIVLQRPPFGEEAETQWIPISSWGYELTKPGVYKLSVELAFPVRTKSGNAITVDEPSPIYITIRGI
jgi:hypothetical protein